MTELECIRPYMGYAILCWVVVDGNLKGTKFYKVNQTEYRSLAEAKAEIRRIVDCEGAAYGDSFGPCPV